MPQYRISEAAKLLGVSDDTIRRWIDSGRIQVHKEVKKNKVGIEDGRQLIEGIDLANLSLELAKEIKDSRSSTVSARNRFIGIVTRIEIDGLTAIVEIQSGPNHIVSLITADAARALDLEVGSKAVASVKSTDVIVEKA